MCLYPKLIINRKYTATKKNKGDVPNLSDERVRYVPVGCGKCMECLKAKASEWRIRLMEEIKHNENYKYFITLTFDPDKIKKLKEEYNLTICNALAGKAIRLFTERYRKQYKKALRHWFITELGQENTERIHIHGILFTPFQINNEWLSKLWNYGKCDTGKYVNEKTINYIVKYLYKIDPKHKNYVPQIFTSRGIGKNYITEFIKEKHKYKGKDTRDYYTLNNGVKIQLPIYYRNKIYSDEEKELLWINRIEEDTRYINGIKFTNVLKDDNSNAYFYRVLNKAQHMNKELGYGDSSEEWKKKDYNITLNMLKKKKKS